MDIRELFGQNVLRLRVRAGLTQAALAERMGIDRSHISLMENGDQNVTLLTLWQVAEALEAEPAELLMQAAPRPSPQ
jgi:transcriptional regulator with XRE-family HTH domain